MKSVRNSHILTTSIFAVAFLAADKGASGGTATAPAPGATTTPAPQTDAKAQTKPEAKVHTKLESLIKTYDETMEKAESYYVEIAELVQTEKISRADVVATLMRARGITFETAQSQYSRMKGIWQNPEVLAQLKSGEITLRMAREKTTKKQAGTVAKDAAAAGSAKGTSATETKEARYERCRKALVASAKECGFDKKSVLLSIESDLTAAGIK